MVTHWKIDKPITLVTFGVGPFELHTETAKMKEGDVPLQFYSLPGGLLAIKEDFILAELNNSLRYFSALFGPYPYSSFGAMYHPGNFGQGFPTMLLLPKSDIATKNTYSFIAHETSHQWWGDVVAWRSYRDQWLSEGFAEYSGALYTGWRERPKDEKELIHSMRESLKSPPRTDLGIGKGRVADLGPIVLGHRLSTSQSANAYTTLIYNKGALVLRMLHFLFIEQETGDGKPFYDMLSDFVRQNYNGWATTESFRKVANEHFTPSTIAQKYKIRDLNWFFQQWVYQAVLPSYRLEYQIESQPGGSVLLKGDVYQDNAPENWFMPLPLVTSFEKGRVAHSIVFAMGSKKSFAARLPARPRKVELDPDEWVLSEKTSARQVK